MENIYKKEDMFEKRETNKSKRVSFESLSCFVTFPQGTLLMNVIKTDNLL